MPARTLLALALAAATLLPPSPSSADSSSWTVSAWLTVDSSAPVPATTRLISIFAEYACCDYPQNGFGIYDNWRQEHIQPCWFVRGYINALPRALLTNRPTGPDLWYHWVAQKVDDAVCVTSNQVPVGCIDSIPGAQLPTTLAYTYQLWPWRIENVQAFDRELTASEIAALYADRPTDFVYDLDSDGDVDGADLQSSVWELASPDPTFISFFATKFGKPVPE